MKQKNGNGTNAMIKMLQSCKFLLNRKIRKKFIFLFNEKKKETTKNPFQSFSHFPAGWLAYVYDISRDKKNGMKVLRKRRMN